MAAAKNNGIPKIKRKLDQVSTVSVPFQYLIYTGMRSQTQVQFTSRVELDGYFCSSAMPEALCCPQSNHLILLAYFRLQYGESPAQHTQEMRSQLLVVNSGKSDRSDSGKSVR